MLEVTNSTIDDHRYEVIEPTDHSADWSIPSICSCSASVLISMVSNERLLMYGCIDHRMLCRELLADTSLTI